MYKIIGVDGKQYGPVSAEQLRQWMGENRVQPATLVQLEGTSEWKPANTVPELASTFASASTALANPPVIGTAARASSKIPAGICAILLGSLGVHKFILGYTGAGLIMLLVSVLTCGLASPVIGVIALIEGILYLTKSDEEFVRTYVDGRKEWF